NRTVTHSLKVSDVPTVTVGGVVYREFVLDIKESRRNPQLSLEELRVFVGNTGNLNKYNTRTNDLSGGALVYDMDAGANNWVKLDARLNLNGTAGDMVLDVPSSLFSGSQYVYLFSRFGDHFASDGGAETWGHRAPTVSPPPPPAVGGIGGL